MQPFTDGWFYLIALAMVLCYLFAGGFVWRIVRERLAEDAHAVVMLEQERKGHFAMLIPKFSVIVLWPLVVVVAITAGILALFRAEAPTV